MHANRYQQVQFVGSRRGFSRYRFRISSKYNIENLPLCDVLSFHKTKNQKKKKTSQNSRPSIRPVFSTYIMYIILPQLIVFRLIKIRSFVSRPAI